MFVYLSKKISLPKQVRGNCLSWESAAGFLACGGSAGFLKVLRFEVQREQDDTLSRGIAGSLNVTLNQTLEAHQQANVKLTAWNPKHQKLASADDSGKIIIWTFYQGVWIEEMVNNRHWSPVACMQWSPDGEYIVIVYQDANIIVGSFDGHRLWGKVLKQPVCALAWSPNGKIILVATENGEPLVYDNSGNYMTRLSDPSQSFSWGSDKIVSIQWTPCHLKNPETGYSSLVIACQSGQLFFLKHERDKEPISRNTGFTIVDMKWNPSGTLLATCGSFPKEEGESVLAVSIYDPFGNLVRSLRFAGNEIKSITWESSGLRLAMAVDTHIYISYCRPEYSWAFIHNPSLFNDQKRQGTVCYAQTISLSNESVVSFWNVKSGEVTQRSVSRVIHISSHGEKCAIVTSLRSASDSRQDGATVELCDSVGRVLKSKIIEFEPRLFYMTNEKMIMIDKSCSLVHVWQYQSSGGSIANSKLAAALNEISLEYTFNISTLSLPGQQKIERCDINAEKFAVTDNRICAVCASDSFIFLAREDGTIDQLSDHDYLYRYRLLEGECQPKELSLNCDGTLLSVIDISGCVRILELETKVILNSNQDSITTEEPAIGKLLPFERRDTWCFKWASDHPTRFALVEKTKLYVFKNFEPEEPLNFSGYLCDFSDLQIQTVFLDDVLRTATAPQPDCFVVVETKSLRDTKSILKQVGFADAFQFVEENPHPRLWRLIGEAALARHDIPNALKSFVQCHDYYAILFLKNLQSIEDKKIQEAQIAVFLNEFERADAIYKSMNRIDLSLELRSFLSDHFSILHTLKDKNSPYKNDALLDKTKVALGEYYYERQQWKNALQYFKESNSFEKLIECAYYLEDYSVMTGVMNDLPARHPLLQVLAERFASVGMAEEASQCYLKYGDMQAALDICIFLQEWQLAFQIASSHNLRVDSFFETYVRTVIDSGQTLKVIELYHKAGYFDESAARLFQLGYENLRHGKSPVLCKKVFVLGAQDAIRFNQLHPSSDIDKSFRTVLQKTNGNSDTHWSFEKPWRCAEAVHFHALALNHFYQRDFSSAIITASLLNGYRNVLGDRVVWSLVALLSHYAKQYSLCSKALQELSMKESSQSSLQNSSSFLVQSQFGKSHLDKYTQLAFDLFQEQEPIDDPSLLTLPKCHSCGHPIESLWNLTQNCSSCKSEHRICVETGQFISADEPFETCQTCTHTFRDIGKQQSKGRVSCPLCHCAL